MPSRAEQERTQQRRALRLLADAPEGMTEALMMAHGFNTELLVGWNNLSGGLAVRRTGLSFRRHLPDAFQHRLSSCTRTTGRRSRVTVF